MGANPFAGLGVDIKAIVGNTIGQFGSVPATLTKKMAGTYDPANPTSGTQGSTADYPCKVLVTRFIEELVADTLVRRVTGKITIILATISNDKWPQNGDAITVIPPVGATRTFKISGKVDVDAVGATATCDVQG